MESGETETQRLFFALWPQDALRTELNTLLERALAGIRGRRVPIPNLHITLAFLGSIDGGQRACIEQAAAAIHAAPCELALDHLHYVRRTRILWLGASVTPEPMAELALGLARAQEACGLAPEKRPFRPHMTLMRHAKAKEVPQLVNPLHWAVTEFVLVESRPLPSGAEYAVLRTFPLIGTA